MEELHATIRPTSVKCIASVSNHLRYKMQTLYTGGDAAYTRSRLRCLALAEIHSSALSHFHNMASPMFCSYVQISSNV